MRPLILASSSPYRQALLKRLGLPFSTHAPEVDERRHEGESALALVLRLAEDKARALALRYPHHLIIGSDQVAVLGDQVLGKPGGFEQALAQLTAASGERVTFLTGLALLDSASGECQVDAVAFSVNMRKLPQDALTRYLQAEQPYDCAGSFKAEGLGVSLFESTEGPDATSLIGLPLIRLVAMLAAMGVAVP
ncbi:nucleoside triphosphate pyrophosphatase [Pseudomonas sp. RIT-PI-S]|uniref:Maf family protein n=1 Tax=Pseudomonas sp. RIT-PI-S TaxID=3035295 RepID=UPI0021D9CBA3|nr:nucleoside triphosphate pyrophosphatase [Pseudomonas sp. RIT-PI-S]